MSEQPHRSELEKVADEEIRRMAGIKPVQGEARVRRLGRFGPPDPAGGRVAPDLPVDEPDDQPEVSTPPEKRAAILLMVIELFAIVMIGLGVGIIFGVGWSFVTMGALIFMVAFIESRDLGSKT